MVRSVRSRPVAISTGRTSAARSVRWPTATGSARPPSRRRAAISRPALGTIASWAGRPLSFLFVPLPAHDYTPSADHCAVNSGDNARSISFSDFNQSVALAKVDLANMIARNSAFAGDRAHKIADFHAIACSDSHEKARHPARCRLGPIAIRRPRPGEWGSVLRCRAPLGALALEYVKRSGSELRRVELLEQGLQRDDLARWNTTVQHCPELLSNGCLAIVRTALGASEIQRREAPTRQLPEPGDLSGPRQNHHLHRLCLSNALELGGRNRRLEKNHRVRQSSEIAFRYANVRVVIVVAERAESLPRALGGRSVACHYQCRGRVEVVEQASERGGRGACAYGDVPDD